MINSINSLVDDYIRSATIEGETKLNGDYKTGNLMAKRLNKIYGKLQKDNDLALSVIGQLLECNVERVQSLAAVDALRLGIYINESIGVLEKISKARQDIIGFSCEMALKLYRGEISGKSL